jgi:acylphosphatase
MASKAVLARITGRVQGVGFRAWTAREAQSLGLGGWVRNEADSSVLALVSGPADRVDDMIGRLGRGPAGAYVHVVELSSAYPTDAPARFEVRH